MTVGVKESGRGGGGESRRGRVRVSKDTVGGEMSFRLMGPCINH